MKKEMSYRKKTILGVLGMILILGVIINSKELIYLLVWNDAEILGKKIFLHYFSIFGGGYFLYLGFKK